MSTLDLKSRLNRIASSPAAKEVKQQTAVVRKPAKSSRPGPKNTWKEPSANYVRVYTQLQEADRNALKSAIAGGRLNDQFESLDHFINEAVVSFMRINKLNPRQGSTLAQLLK